MINNEMDLALIHSDDGELYREAYEEAQRIIRISDEIRISLEKVTKPSEQSMNAAESDDGGNEKLSTSELAKKLGLSTKVLLDTFTMICLLES